MPIHQMIFSFIEKYYFHSTHSNLVQHDLINYISPWCFTRMLSFFESLLILTKCSNLVLLLQYFFLSFFISSNDYACFKCFVQIFKVFLLFKLVFLYSLETVQSNQISFSSKCFLWISKLNILWEYLWLDF